MSFLIVEIKARTDHPDHIRKVLTENQARCKGIDQQVDTYFRCNFGRLKLREGTIENQLIHYHRENKLGPKNSLVTLYEPNPDPQLKEVLTNALGILVIVKKKREIYFIDNVEFHIDVVEKLGSFIEIEAIDHTGEMGKSQLLQQCKNFMSLFKIQKDDLIKNSYSDMLLKMVQGEN